LKVVGCRVEEGSDVSGDRILLGSTVGEAVGTLLGLVVIEYVGGTVGEEEGVLVVDE